MLIIAVSDPISEFVTKAQPLLLHQDLEPLEGSVVGVEEEHWKRSQLSCPVPAITAVDNNTGFLILNLQFKKN